MNNKQHKPGTQTNEAHVQGVLIKYLSYFPLFLFFIIVSLVGAYFYLRYAVPKFEADATIIIKDAKKGSDDSQLMTSLDAINAKKIIENEMEVLQSRSLMNTVAKKLHLYAPVSQEGKIKSISAYQSCPLTIEAISPDSLKFVERINLGYDSAKGTISLDKVSYGSVNEWLRTPFGILKFSRNEKYSPNNENKPFFFALIPPKNVAGSILSNLKVTAPNKNSSVIDLTYRDEIPKRAEDILNELIVSYGNAALTEKNILAKNTLAFIEERLNVVSHALDSIESKLKRYKASSGAVDISKQGQLYLDNVSANDKRLTDLNIQSDALSEMEQAATKGLAPSTLGINDPTLTNQIISLSTLQQQYDKQRATMGENHPALKALTNQINELRPAIISNIQSQRKTLELTKSSITSNAGTYNSMISAIPQKEQQLVEITRDQNIKNGIYSFLLQKREESELSLASSISDSRVVNYAQASGFPVSPNKMIIYVMAVAIALGLPIALITAREALSPKILYRNEIETLTQMPIIGEVAFNKSKERLVVQSGVRSMMAEEFRKIRVSLLSLGIDAQHKKILITSSISGEGKSFISANLATSLSLTGKRVVLVDMDLHNPGLGKFFSIKEQEGVSDYLIGKKELGQIIHRLPETENLYYISSGTLQPDSSELLENGKIKTMITKLDADFDIVIIDAAPIGLITDAYLLSSLCDATLYVVMHKITPKILIKRIDDNMAVNPIKNPAIIFNGVKTRGFFKNNYGYGYNYAYGYDNKKNKKSYKS